MLFLLGAAPALAQPAPPASAYVGKPVASITITLEGRRSTDPTLADAVQLKPNQPLDMADVRETMTHLYTLGRFEDVQVEAVAAPDGGVAITIALQPIHVVTRVEFRGGLGLPESALRARMTERFGATPPVGSATAVAAVLQELYAERGYLAAAVTPAAPILEHQPERATLIFDVAAGSRAMIGRSDVTGQPLEPPARVQARLHLAPGQPYQPGDLRDQLATYVTWMRRRGYYQADARVLAPCFNADRTQADLTVDVVPGPLVSVQFTGDPLPADKRRELVPIEREGSVDEDILEDAAHRISDYFQQQGYWKADVAAPERKEENGRLIITFRVLRGPLFRVAPGGLQVTGAHAVSPDELRPYFKLAAGDPFVASKMSAIEGAIKQLYLTRGYAAVEVESQPNQTGPDLVEPVIVVKEGPRVLVGGVSMRGNDKVPTRDLLAQISVKTGAPYYGPSIAADRDRLVGHYLNLGFETADVTVPRPQPTLEGGAARADLVFEVREGPQTRVEHIFITGNVRTDPDVIRRELRIREAAPLGQQELTESRRNLAALGLFRRIQIAAVSHGDPGRSDVIVTVEESQRTTVDYGGGVQMEHILRESDATGTPAERYEFAPRGFFEIGRRNMGGKNRSMNLYTRFGLRPSPDPADSNPFGFSEYRVVGTYREPKAWRNYGDLTGTAAVEQGVRTGFNFVRKGLNAELTHRLSTRVRATGQYAFTTTRIFDEALSIEDRLSVDRVFSQVRLSSFSGALSRDTRDDLLSPQHGSLLSADATLAARTLGSEVGFVKVYLQGFLYRNLGRPNLVFAGGARLGVARALQQLVDGQIVQDLPASERFFAGGDTTIRGFARDSVGTPATLTVQGFPKGGDAEVVLNAELRMPVKGDVGAVVFVDSGNVFARAADVNLGSLRAALGLGGRYRSPIGPIRIDVGFPLNRRFIGTSLEKRFQVHFSMGHAF